MISLPLVLVHGFLGGSAQWELQRQSLEKDIQLITIDLPGFGTNNQLEAPDTISGFANFVLEYLTEIGVERFNLLGHSMGGMIAQEITHRDQEHIEKLILYGTGPVGVMPGRFETIAESKERAKRDGPEKTARHIAATWFLDREKAKHFEATANIAQKASLEAITAGLDAMEAWSGVEYLAHVNRETLVLWGDHDRAYQWPQPYRLWSEIAQAGLAVVPGCSHAVHAEKPKLFNALILDFLSD